MELRGRFSIAAKRMSRSIIRELLKLTSKPGLISFAGGLPFAGGFAAGEIRDICARVLQDSPQVALQYSATEGLPELRDLLVSFLAQHGLRVGREELVVTSASQQSLDLVGKIFLERGDTVVTENPSYLGAVSAFRSYGVRFLPIDMDDEGLRTGSLRRELKELKATAGSGEEYYQNMPKFLYTVPDFQNPTGITMSLRRRRELLEVAEEFDLLIVEDVPYKWLRFAGEDLPTLGGLERCAPDAGRRVIGLYTFSKILSPGLRLGWVTADPQIIDKLVQAKQAVDLCSSSLAQCIAVEFLKSGKLQRAIEASREAYAAKAKLMLEALERHMPRTPGLRWVVPQGGMFLWITLPETMDADEMFREALQRDVAYVVGSAFYPNGGGHNTMRLNFSYPSEEEIREGIRRLAGLIGSRAAAGAPEPARPG
jgi:2-aminoadipate transaminase